MYKTIALILLVSNPMQALALPQRDICELAAKVAGFALHSRSSGTSKIDVNEIVSVIFPTNGYADSAILAERVIDQIYDLSQAQIKNMKSIDKDAMEAIEIGTFRRCIEDQW
jgi:hypothetical protein